MNTFLLKNLIKPEKRVIFALDSNLKFDSHGNLIPFNGKESASHSHKWIERPDGKMARKPASNGENHVEEVGLNLGFYYPLTDTFYGILTEMRPVKVKTLPRDRRRSDFIGWQCDCDPHDEDQLIATFDDITEVWDGLKIDGKDFEEVIMHSYIVALN